MSDPAFKAKQDLSNLYYLKYKLNPETLEPSTRPHLEIDISEKPDELVKTVNREDWNVALKKHSYTVIEVFSRKCPGCRRIEPLLPRLADRIR